LLCVALETSNYWSTSVGQQFIGRLPHDPYYEKYRSTYISATHWTTELSYICQYHSKSLIFPETRVIGLHFCRCMFGSILIQICAVGSKRRIFSAQELFLAVQGRSGSSKVDDFGTNRKRVYDSLLVGHCDYGPILHRF